MSKAIATSARLRDHGGARYRVDALMPPPPGMRAVFHWEGEVWDTPVFALGAARQTFDDELSDESTIVGVVLDEEDEQTLMIAESSREHGGGKFAGYRFESQGSLADWITEHAKSDPCIPTARTEQQKCAAARVEAAHLELRQAQAAFAVAMGWAEPSASEGDTVIEPAHASEEAERALVQTTHAEGPRAKAKKGSAL